MESNKPWESEEYKGEVLRHLRLWLIEDNGHRYFADHGYDISVEEIRLELPGLDDEAVILFREASRPECLFGYKASLAEPATSEGPIFPDSEGWAGVILSTLDGRITAIDRGLPDECEPDGITWI